MVPVVPGVHPGQSRRVHLRPRLRAPLDPVRSRRRSCRRTRPRRRGAASRKRAHGVIGPRRAINSHLVARRSPERRATRHSGTELPRWIHSKFVAGTCYGGYRPGQYSRHERNTRTPDPADLRRRGSAAPAGATGQATQALRGRGVGGDCRRDHFHLVGHLLLRRHNPRAPLPPLSPRHVQTRWSGWSRWPVGRPAGGVRTVAAWLPWRTGWPRRGTSAFRWTWWSGRPVRWSDRSGWSRPVADDRLSGSRPVAAPLAARNSAPVFFLTGSTEGAC